MPMRSLTADRIRCVQPRQRSVVWTKTLPQKKLDLLQLASRRAAEALKQLFYRGLTQLAMQ